MKATALKTTLGSGAFALALIGGAALVSAPASANPNQSYWGGSVSSGAPGTYQQVRRRVYVPPAYAYDPGYDGPAYDGPSIDYGPPVAYGPPPVAYDYDEGPPDDYDYGPGPGIAFVAPGAGFAIGY
jgi:hypothetical protein